MSEWVSWVSRHAIGHVWDEVPLHSLTTSTAIRRRLWLIAYCCLSDIRPGMKSGQGCLDWTVTPGMLSAHLQTALYWPVIGQPQWIGWVARRIHSTMANITNASLPTAFSLSEQDSRMSAEWLARWTDRLRMRLSSRRRASTTCLWITSIHCTLYTRRLHSPLPVY